MRIKFRGCLNNLYFFIITAITVTIFIKWSHKFPRRSRSLQNKDNDTVVKEKRFHDSGLEEGSTHPLISYEDFEQLTYDSTRVGLGEHGMRAVLPPELERKKKTLWDIFGFNGLLSDQIAVDRSLTDIRHSSCVGLKYPNALPTASIVIPFYEEHLKTLQRTITTAIKRSPSHLLKEIILIDDGSRLSESTGKPLENWLESTLPRDKYRLIRMESQVGLIAARMAGADIARGDVIIVLDSHCEAMYNWMVPLLAPILKDYRTVVSPLIDVINGEDFSYGIQDNGGRGGFDWRLFYKRMPLLHDQAQTLPEPFENPVMNGGLFAISRAFFRELGGYDPGIRIWGGEQYELSFKIWQCGGRLLDAPCSRVGHIFRGPAPKRPRGHKGNYIDTNYKRLAKVWMGKYIDALYKRLPHLQSVDEGDLSRQIQIRDTLECKSFDWFLNTIAFDILKYYPPYEPPDYANGTIKSMYSPNLCLDTGGSNHGPVISYSCHGHSNQIFRFCFRKSIKIPNEQFCFQTPRRTGDELIMSNCQNINVPAQQVWHYDLNTLQIKEKARSTCLELEEDKRVTVKKCEEDNQRQKWEFTYVNRRLIRERYPKL